MKYGKSIILSVSMTIRHDGGLLWCLLESSKFDDKYSVELVFHCQKSYEVVHWILGRVENWKNFTKVNVPVFFQWFLMYRK